MALKDNLYRLRKQVGLSQGALATKAGVSQQLISQIERGENVQTVKLPALAHALGVDVSALDPSFGATPAAPGMMFLDVPILTWVSAGNLSASEQITHFDGHSIRLFLPTDGDWFGLTVEGDSMDRIAPNGATIIVNRKDRSPAHDRSYIFRRDDGWSTFKRFKRGTPPKMQPFSFNPDHETLTIGDDIEVLGRVRYVINEI